MNLSESLKKIYTEKGLTKNTRLRIICKDGDTVEGLYYGFTSDLDNEPEEAEIDIRVDGGLSVIGIPESEIDNIEVITA